MMDFLDPRKRRSHKQRLFVGYALMAVVVGLGGIILFNAASGYGVNPRTGDIIQNGLLFVGSTPENANIYLDDKLFNAKTSARLILPAGTYNLTIQKEGYHSWTRRIVLDEHKVARYNYPLLFPVNPQVVPIKNYTSSPLFLTQTPDWRWLLVQRPADGAEVIFDEFDTADPILPPRALTLSSSLLTNFGPTSQFKEVEWASDNNNLLLEHIFSGGKEYIIFNRSNPERSLNLNRLLNISPTAAAWRNNQFGEVYILHRAEGELAIVSIEQPAINPILNNVAAFKAAGRSFINYVSQPRNGQVTAYIYDGSQSYPLRSFQQGDNYLLSAVQYQGRWYYTAGSNKEERINIYRDPLGPLRDPARGTATPMLALPTKGATEVSFSTNRRFLATQSGQYIAVYDIEDRSAHRHTLNVPVKGPVRWVDGFHLMGHSQDSKVLIMDYDSSNQQLPLTSSYPRIFFERDYKYLLAIVPAAKGADLVKVDMRAGEDLPKQ